MRDRNIYDSLKCIWMVSDVVTYKLCDREFDCENCSFDKAIRNIQEEQKPVLDLADNKDADNVIKRIIKKISEREPKGSYIYLNNNLIVKNLYGDIYYFGFSPAAIHLLDNLLSIEYNTGKDSYLKTEQFLTLKGEWGSVDIASPINFGWREKVMTSKDQITSERWLGLIDINKDDLANNSISVNDYFNDVLQVAAQLENVEKSFPLVGPTMYDGGREITSLYAAIGKENYLKILRSLFNFQQNK